MHLKRTEKRHWIILAHASAWLLLFIYEVLMSYSISGTWYPLPFIVNIAALAASAYATAWAVHSALQRCSRLMYAALLSICAGLLVAGVYYFFALATETLWASMQLMPDNTQPAAQFFYRKIYRVSYFEYMGAIYGGLVYFAKLYRKQKAEAYASAVRLEALRTKVEASAQYATGSLQLHLLQLLHRTNDIEQKNNLVRHIYTITGSMPADETALVPLAEEIARVRSLIAVYNEMRNAGDPDIAINISGSDAGRSIVFYTLAHLVAKPIITGDQVTGNFPQRILVRCGADAIHISIHTRQPFIEETLRPLRQRLLVVYGPGCSIEQHAGEAGNTLRIVINDRSAMPALLQFNNISAQ